MHRSPVWFEYFYIFTASWCYLRRGIARLPVVLERFAGNTERCRRGWKHAVSRLNPMPGFTIRHRTLPPPAEKCRLAQPGGIRQ